MSSEQAFAFTKENLDTYLKALAKEYRRLNKKAVPAELILIGGASVLINYGFRNMTTDVDAIIQASSSIKDAINYTGDKFGLPNGWLNSDFILTDSYSPKLAEFSRYYRSFSNIVTVRTVDAEYLIAMKLRSGRQYKNDLSDILGILSEHEKTGKPITIKRIQKAVCDLYGDWSVLSESARDFIEDVMQDGRYDLLYSQVMDGEQRAKKALIIFEQQYPNTVTETNVGEILQRLQVNQKKQPHHTDRER